jgi:hypothetical protein
VAYRGYFLLNGQEMANTSRVLAHMGVMPPTIDGQTANQMPCACQVQIPYDDSWTGLQDAVGDGPYVIEDAPWYNAARPESAEFAGVWMMEVGGFDTVTVEREVAEALCVGGIASTSRDATQAMTFSALVVACSNAGARYGIDWLACTLRQATARGGVDLEYYKAHPDGSAADPSTLRRARYGVVLTKSPQAVENMGRDGGVPHRQASIYRVEWEMVATNPYSYGVSDIVPVVWDTQVEENITWAHAPDCADTSSCGLPTVYNADCIPPDVTVATAAIPSCGGCLPICAIERRTWQMPLQFGSCDDTTVTVRVENTSETETLTVLMYWQPCGSEDRCERTGALQVSGLPAGQIAVADSVTGRPYVLVDNVSHRQVGIVSTPTGRPWTPTTLESLTCWELVAESAPGTEYSVTIELRDRDA